jgi:cellulose synthase/poly-beta-1,6-N-acetylglucosamine synthase-like glycosyltransferase
VRATLGDARAGRKIIPARDGREDPPAAIDGCDPWGWAQATTARDAAGDWSAVARALGLPFLDRIDVDLADPKAEPPPPAAFTRAEALLLGEGADSLLVVAPDATTQALVAAFLTLHPEERRRLAVASPKQIRHALIERWSPALTRRAVAAMIRRRGGVSAAAMLHPGLLLFVALLVAAWILSVFGFTWAIVGWTVAFLTLGTLRLLAADTSPSRPRPIPRQPDATLPRYAVLVPVYREAAVVPDLVADLARLDYPQDRLEIRLIVEGDDHETRRAAEAAVAVAAAPIDVVVVPPSQPRTKPKALNFALSTVDADFVTIFDAEDRPDPDQLRRALAAFAAGPPELAVVQAALEIDHVEDARPWLVRQFEIEYAMLFRGVLPWLAERDLLLPLGGTSNHFRRAALDEVGGWDPHNVTEDADMAVRLARYGWRAGVIASSTREEAPTRPRAWLAQRTRWMKGWMQTWFAHMRAPIRLHRDLGLIDALVFHVVFAGQILSSATYVPSLLLLFLQATGTVPLFGASTLDGDVLMVAALGAFASGVIGALILAAKVSTRVPRRFRLFDVATMPIYWCGFSVAVWLAVIELLWRPHRWNKTTHGVVRRRPDADPGGEPQAVDCELGRMAERA